MAFGNQMQMGRLQFRLVPLFSMTSTTTHIQIANIQYNTTKT
jgi:hypothetical protein